MKRKCQKKVDESISPFSDILVWRGRPFCFVPIVFRSQIRNLQMDLVHFSRKWPCPSNVFLSNWKDDILDDVGLTLVLYEIAKNGARGKCRIVLNQHEKVVVHKILRVFAHSNESDFSTFQLSLQIYEIKRVSVNWEPCKMLFCTLGKSVFNNTMPQVRRTNAKL